jgi:hypothetical protein
MVGNGSGSFTSADSAISSMPATYGIQSLCAVDTDGDGRAEIVAGQGLNQAGTGPVFNYSALTTGAFFVGWAARGTITSPLYASMDGCAVGDFLGTGIPTVVTSFSGSPNYAPGNFRLLSLWSGSGLTTQTNLPSPAEITKSMCAIDADFDPKTDYAVTTKPGGILVYKGSGQTLAATLDASVGSPTVTTPQTGRIAAGDLDGDGRTDLLATTSCWFNESMANYYSTIYTLGTCANGGSMGIVFYLNSSN